MPRVLLRDLDPAHVERIARAALAEPSRLAAARFLVATIGELESELPGLRNEGLFAAHELRTGVITLPSWPAACEHGRTLLDHRGRELVEALGFTVEAHGTATSVLRAGEGDTATAVAIFLDETETYEGAAQRFSGTSPVSLRPGQGRRRSPALRRHHSRRPDQALRRRQAHRRRGAQGAH